ncbi:hypothetical protein MHYP_G00202010 [Metynnis hypsauchen]
MRSAVPSILREESHAGLPVSVGLYGFRKAPEQQLHSDSERLSGSPTQQEALPSVSPSVLSSQVWGKKARDELNHCFICGSYVCPCAVLMLICRVDREAVACSSGSRAFVHVFLHLSENMVSKSNQRVSALL